ncbi:Aldolase-type TIM barrel [Phytophthora cactorum]|nr:Aldolase-type TIM barrel [Phytophthora cactorum]
MYGGSIENRAQLIFEAVDLVLSSLPLSQVGIRLSPVSETFGCKDSAPRETYGYDLVYLSVVERRGIHADNTGVSTNGVAHHFRSIYNGVLNTAAGIDHVGAMQIVEDACTSGATEGSTGDSGASHQTSYPKRMMRMRCASKV